MNKFMLASNCRSGLVATGVGLLAILCIVPQQIVRAQQPVPVNPLIVKLKQGKAVLTPDDWMFIDMEHGPYLMDRLQTTLDDLGKKTYSSSGSCRRSGPKSGTWPCAMVN